MRRAAAPLRGDVSAARSQLWNIVEEISGQLDSADGDDGSTDAGGGGGAAPGGASSPLPPVLAAPAQKLRRLLHLHRRMQRQERVLRAAHVAVLRERNDYLRRLGDVEAYVDAALAARAAAGPGPDDERGGGGLLERLSAFLRLRKLDDDRGRGEGGGSDEGAYPNPCR